MQNTQRKTTSFRPDLRIVPTTKSNRRVKKKSSFAELLVTLLFLGLMIASALRTISLQTRLVLARKTYAGLQVQYAELQRANDLYEEHIISEIDLEEIRKMAEEELGMHPANKGQIIFYDGEIDDYVRQYNPIPQ